MKNGPSNGRQRDVDHVPVVKFFNPFGAGVWLATELDEDGNIMFGLGVTGSLSVAVAVGLRFLKR